MQPGNLIGPIIVAIGVVIAAMVFAVVTTLLQTADSGTELRLTRMEDAAVASAEELKAATNEINRLGADLARLREEMSLLANRTPVVQTSPEPSQQSGEDPSLLLPDEDFENPPETEALTETMKLAKTRFNKGITQPRNRTMMEILGPPRDSYSTDCQSVTNPNLKGLLEAKQVGPIKVTMLKPALESLERILNRLKESDPDIYAKVGTAGALCARFIRGSTTSVSNHSWGSAIDITLQGELDRFADGGTQFGLLILAEYFNDEGWYWGAVYNREDSMHFEVGEETLRAWKAAGKL
jgi:D-alanyl-D-alanine carboxypeptidase